VRLRSKEQEAKKRLIGEKFVALVREEHDDRDEGEDKSKRDSMYFVVAERQEGEEKERRI
jgi:hypothetical protein